FEVSNDYWQYPPSAAMAACRAARGYRTRYRSGQRGDAAG
ncbi:hypothetical protein AZ019_004709, partial [Klebsiella pneumoniae]